jgi:hypothetical protein
MVGLSIVLAARVSFYDCGLSSSTLHFAVARPLFVDGWTGDVLSVVLAAWVRF